MLFLFGDRFIIESFLLKKKSFDINKISINSLTVGYNIGESALILVNETVFEVDVQELSLTRFPAERVSHLQNFPLQE
jgi:hypothetical protein